MANRKDVDQDFTSDVDRMIAGNSESPAGGSKSDADVGFATKVRNARVQPSQAFQSALKQRLLAKLAAMEAEEPKQHQASVSRWLADLFSQRAWQVAGAALAVVVVAAIVTWRMGLFQNQVPVVTNPYPTVAIDTRATLDRDSYQLGQSVEIHLLFRNVSNQTLEFPWPPAMRIETTDAQMVRAFAPGKVSNSLAPGQSETYSLTWDQRDGGGGQVAAGEYLIVVPNVKLGEAGFLSLVSAPNIDLTAPP
jgi:hypothetical protein